MKLDAARSRLTLFTFAEGLFSKLAHDLELVAGDLTGGGTGEPAVVEVRIPGASIRVKGAVKKGKVDPGVLSSGDRAAIERQIRDEILPGAAVVARGQRDGERATIEITAPRGKARVSCPVKVAADAGATRVSGQVDVSLSALGCPQVKGPMGAFRVADKVRVDFDFTFT